MSVSCVEPSVAAMNTVKSLNWPLIFGLAVLALLRPVIRVVAHQMDVGVSPAVPVILTVAISLVWVLAVGLSDVAHPVWTLLLTGVVYAVASVFLSALLSPALTGELQGPLRLPVAILPVMLTNMIWGLLTGVLALALQRARRFPHQS